MVRNAKVDAVTTTGSEVALRATAELAARLGLRFYADPETVRRCQDKDAMRAAYAAGGVAVPPFAACETLEQAQSFAKREGYPLVVKPSRGWGQRGVARVEDDGELASGVRGGAGPLGERGPCRSSWSRRWLEGREYSVNGWIEDDKLVSYCVTERVTLPGRKPLGIMLAEVYPSGLSPADEARVVDEARRGAAALGHTRGPCYSQVALGPRGCFLFETAARLGGGFDADVTRLASGVDLYDRLLGVAVGDAALERQGVVASAHGGADREVPRRAPRRGARRSGAWTRPARCAGVDDAEIFVPVGGTRAPAHRQRQARGLRPRTRRLARARPRRAPTPRSHASRIDTRDEVPRGGDLK